MRKMNGTYNRYAPGEKSESTNEFKYSMGCSRGGEKETPRGRQSSKQAGSAKKVVVPERAAFKFGHRFTAGIEARRRLRQRGDGGGAGNKGSAKGKMFKKENLANVGTGRQNAKIQMKKGKSPFLCDRTLCHHPREPAKGRYRKSAQAFQCIRPLRRMGRKTHHKRSGSGCCEGGHLTGITKGALRLLGPQELKKSKEEKRLLGDDLCRGHSRRKEQSSLDLMTGKRSSGGS